jgi:hypothetical protein
MSTNRSIAKEPKRTSLRVETPANMAGEERVRKERLLGTLQALSPEANAANLVHLFAPAISGEIDVQRYYEELHSRNTNGDFVQTAEHTLRSQAATLDVLFGSLARRAGLNMGEYLGAGETYMKLALRAQNQCRMTLETLAAIKNPPVVFAKQANIANNQQVNNGEAVPVAHAPETSTRPTELLEAPHAKPEWMDARAARAAASGDPAVATVETINRAKNAGR